MDLAQNMEFWAELLRCGGTVYTWCYRADETLWHSNCPDEAFLAGEFELFGYKHKMMEYAKEHDPPVTLGTALGVQWGVCFEKSEVKLVHA